MLFVSTLYRAVYALDIYPFFPLLEVFFLSFFLSFLFKKREGEREDRGGRGFNAIMTFSIGMYRIEMDVMLVF